MRSYMIKLHSLSLHDVFPWSATFYYKCYARVIAVVSVVFPLHFFYSFIELIRQNAHTHIYIRIRILIHMFMDTHFWLLFYHQSFRHVRVMLNFDDEYFLCYLLCGAINTILCITVNISTHYTVYPVCVMHAIPYVHWSSLRC